LNDERLYDSSLCLELGKILFKMLDGSGGAVQKMIDDGLEKEGEVETLLSNAKTRTESVEPRKGIDFDD
jgi:hypothetical protein